jgi:hypothetical protein
VTLHAIGTRKTDQSVRQPGRHACGQQPGKGPLKAGWTRTSRWKHH